MTLDDLSKLDLRLLIAFNALIEERSVTRAAERLQLSQPAMSRNLQRLRQLFGDELFTRQSHGLSPSPRAEQIHSQLQPLLDDILRLVSPVQIQLANLQRTFRIGVLDIVSQIIIAPLIEEINKRAPKVTLKLINLDSHSMDALVSGQLDCIINLGNEAPANIHSKILSNEEAVCLVPKTHPYSKSTLTVERFKELPFVDFWVPGFNDDHVIDPLLELRDIRLETNNLMTALNAVCDMGMAMVCGSNISVYNLPRQDEVEVMELPFDGPMEPVPLRLLWHRRYHEDVEHRWFRDLIDELFIPIRNAAVSLKNADQLAIS